jgi:hypothetical protein
LPFLADSTALPLTRSLLIALGYPDNLPISRSLIICKSLLPHKATCLVFEELEHGHLVHLEAGTVIPISLYDDTQYDDT